MTSIILENAVLQIKFFDPEFSAHGELLYHY